MDDITIGQIKRLESVGLAIVDSIETEYNSCRSQSECTNAFIHDIYNTFAKKLEQIDTEEKSNEE